MIREAILYHVYSGHLFFTAVLMFIAGLAGGRRTRVLPLLAIPLAAFSGTPMPLWQAIPLTAIAIFATFTNRHALWSAGGPAGVLPERSPARPPALHFVRVIAVIAALAAAALELPYHVGSTTVAKPQRLIVIGDSLSTGANPWPRRLGVDVVNLARDSDRAPAAAADQTSLMPAAEPGDVVIVEIGGNDMLEGSDVASYERALDSILRHSAPRTTIVLELPILPGRWSYGTAQRRVAKRHRAVFIPKRILAGTLAEARNTADGLHLTDRGHEHLARSLGHTLAWD